jgi:PAS domain S-box-containing protein
MPPSSDTLINGLYGLQETREQILTLIESLPQLVWTTGPDGVPDFVNQRWIDYTGFGLEETIALGWGFFLPPEDQEPTATAWQQAVQTGEPYSVEYRLRRHDGTFRWLLTRGVPIRDSRGAVTRWFGTCTDIDDQKREVAERLQAEAEHARLAAEVSAQRKRLNDIIGSVPGVVWEAWGEPDAESQRIDFVSSHVEQMLGYTVEDWVGTPNFWATIVHPDDREQAVRVASEAWANGSQHINTFRWITRDGRALWCESHSVIVKDADGNAIGMRGVTIDISERKRAEAERARHLAEIETLNAQLRRAMTETHHRVRNSLQIVSALIELEAPEPGETVDADDFHHISGHVRALAAVHDLLTEQAKQDSAAVDLSARELLGKLVDLVRQTAGNRRVVLEAADARLAVQQGTPLAVVTHELITNAVKYGTGILGVTFSVHDGLATLEVADDGPGFPLSFDPAGSGSTGLELVAQIARWDLRAHDVHFDNRPQGGGRVRIIFPLRVETGPVPFTPRA